MNFTMEQILLFLGFTLVTYLASIVNRRNVDSKGEQAKNEAVGAVNKIATEALSDVRNATKTLLSESEKRARLEGKVEQLAKQVESERTKSEKAALKAALQDKQITTLFNDLQDMSGKLNTVRQRLAEVEEEKALLVEDKRKLENALDKKGDAYDELIASIQGRIDEAVSDVESKLRQHYQEKISLLEQQIHNKDLEIEHLKSKIEEETHHEDPTNTPKSIPTNDATTIPNADSSAD